jgi:tetratricopeptide (TPR) repeat protein
MTLNNLGIAQREVRRFEEAITAHTQAAAIYVEAGDRHREGGALNNLGGALLGVRRFGEAITAYTQAAAIYVEVGDRHREATALNNLGLAQRQMSRSGRLGRLWRVVLGRVGVYRKRSSAIDHPTPLPAPSPQVADQQNPTPKST